MTSKDTVSLYLSPRWKHNFVHLCIVIVFHPLREVSLLGFLERLPGAHFINCAYAQICAYSHFH